VTHISFGEHVKNPLKWTSVVEAACHDLESSVCVSTSFAPTM
jgi:hypothetical protein